MKIFRSIYVLFTLFVVGIIVPASILTYVGFRSFRYEDQLLDRLTEDRDITLADEVVRVWQDQLAVSLSSVTAFVKNHNLAGAEPETVAATLLPASTINGVPVQTWLLYAKDGTLRFPLRTDIFAMPTVHDVDWGPFANHIRALEQLEFSSGNVAAAAQGYRDLLKADMTLAQRRELLKMLGAAEKKKGDLHETEQTYRQLASEFDQVIDASGFPTGVVARQLLLRAYQSFHAPAPANAVREELFYSMAAWRWPVSSEMRDRVLTESDPGTPASKAFRSGIDRYALVARKFELTASAPLRVALRSRGWGDAGGIVDSPVGVAIAVPISDGSGPFAGGRFIALLARDSFWSHPRAAVLEKIQGSSVTVAAMLPMGRVQWGVGSEQVIVLERIVGNVEPPIHFSFRAPSSGRLLITMRRRRIFGGMIGLSALVIIAGLGLMFRAIRKERENTELKAEFVANVSHELKTPLSTILYIGERLSAGRYQPHDTGRFYTLLNREASRLKNLMVP